ncbi:MAG: hypothetical protein FJ082_15235 [Cyanobacteria bacterium K_Offshore_surface_m2_011]|nr:hypothetical protein [Cyanobacteria bacterium K_Offshore_surface_m2_011]
MKRCQLLIVPAVAAVAFALALPGASEARPNPGGLGGPASGAGVLPGAGFGEAGAGLERGPEGNPGGLGGPASGAGVRPGLGYGAPGAGVYRR